jgi:hypothetical protein
MIVLIIKDLRFLIGLFGIFGLEREEAARIARPG